MSPAKHRYAGPQPPCPHNLDDPPPDLDPDQLAVPTTELYSAALEHAWAELASTASPSQRPTPARVDELEPRPDDPSRPRPAHHGPYALHRAGLDWTYHVVPSRARQQLQDEIVTLVLQQRLRECDEAGDDEPCRVSEQREGFSRQEADPEGVRGVKSEDMGRKGGEGEEDRPLALFTAGCVPLSHEPPEPDSRTSTTDARLPARSGMGAGKGHTLKELLKSHAVRLPRNTVWIDPDALSRMLPERPQYVAHDPENASALLHPEASLLQEVCASVAREQRRSLVVDGSLTDCGWFEGFMRCVARALSVFGLCIPEGAQTDAGLCCWRPQAVPRGGLRLRDPLRRASLSLSLTFLPPSSRTTRTFSSCSLLVLLLLLSSC